MASWQSICKRLRSKHFSLCLCSPCQAHETEIKSQRDKRPNSKQTVAHCAVVNSNEAMATRVVSQTHTERHTSQPSRPLAVAKSRSAHGGAAAVCLWGEFELGGVQRLRAVAFALKKASVFSFIALSCGCNWIYSCCRTCNISWSGYRHVPHCVNLSTPASVWSIWEITLTADTAAVIPEGGGKNTWRVTKDISCLCCRRNIFH